MEKPLLLLWNWEGSWKSIHFCHSHGIFFSCPIVRSGFVSDLASLFQLPFPGLYVLVLWILFEAVWMCPASSLIKWIKQAFGKCSLYICIRFKFLSFENSTLTPGDSNMCPRLRVTTAEGSWDPGGFHRQDTALSIPSKIIVISWGPFMRPPDHNKNEHL